MSEIRGCTKEELEAQNQSRKRVGKADERRAKLVKAIYDRYTKAIQPWKDDYDRDCKAAQADYEAVCERERVYMRNWYASLEAGLPCRLLPEEDK